MKPSAAVAAAIAPNHRGHGPLVHARTAFSFTINASKHDAFPLFGASGERRWGTDSSGQAWDPQFLWPQPERDTEGEVFLITHGHNGQNAVWINTAYDETAGHIQYAYFLEDSLVTRIDIHLTELVPDKTQVDVVYEQTALDAVANERILRTSHHGDDMAKEWSEQIATARR